jgi:Binding-prot-dependent transport system membrane comp, N-term/Acetamidase/Formamidase family
MGAYIARRLIQSVLTLLGVSFVTFFLLFVIPADPARAILGHAFASPEQFANLRQQLGLDLPFYERYFIYLNNLIHGDLGRSYLQKTEVSVLLWSRAAPTALLVAGAIFFEVTIGLTMGLLASIWRNSRTDRALMVASFIIVSAPQFVVGQGDGEVCGTAIESPMSVVLSFDVVRGANLKTPRFTTAGPVARHLDTKGYEVTTGVGPDLMEGARAAVMNMIDLLSARYKMAPVDAYMLCSVCGDLRISEIVDQPNWVVSFYFPRVVLE